MSSESLSLVVQPRQRGTPRIRPDSRTATVWESGEICRSPEANTRGGATLLVGAPPQGEQGADQCASPGGRICSRLWCPDQGRGDIDVWEIRYEPSIFVGTHSISKEQKLELSFVGYVLERLQSTVARTAGKIIGTDGTAHTVKLGESSKDSDGFLNPSTHGPRLTPQTPSHCLE